MILRKYQEEAVQSLFDYFYDNNGSPLVVMPTASGKSLVLAEFLRRALRQYPDERFLVATHRKELLAQNTDKIRTLWPEAPVGVYSAGLKSRDIAQITVGGVQSIYRRAAELGDVGVVIIDEVHLVPKDGQGMYLTLLAGLREINPSLRVVGLTATPYRLDSGYLHVGEDRIFTDICYEADMQKLILNGYLCPLRSRVSEVETNLTGVHVRGGEYIPEELESVMGEQKLVADSVAEVVRVCKDRKRWLVFCCGIEHAQKVTAAIAGYGISVGCVTSKSIDRDEVLDSFKSGKLQAVVNVNILTTGFDQPDIDALVMLRPTLSTGLYVQMAGRGMRLHESKRDCVVLDFAGNIMRHGPLTGLTVKQKGTGEARGPGWKMCPSCRDVIPGHRPTCPSCGYVFPVEPRELKHGREYADRDIIGSIRTEDVDRVVYEPHYKAMRPVSLKVTYCCGYREYHEWICVEHDGYAGEKAARWLAARGVRAATVDEVIAQKDRLLIPKQIVVDTEEKYPRILAHRDLTALPPLEDVDA